MLNPTPARCKHAPPGDSDLLVAGGMESMSNVPYYLPQQRTGARLGHVQAVDGLVKDGEAPAGRRPGAACLRAGAGAGVGGLGL
jgi:acetyl-CoA acetyltransferase